MPLTLPYTAIITEEDLLGAGSGVDVETGDAARTACASATARIEAYLNRRLIVRAVTWRTRSAEWRYDTSGPEVGTESRLWAYWAPDWPVVSLEGDDGTDDDVAVTLGDSRRGGQQVWSETRLEALTGFAGYRRHDQTLTDLQSETGLSELATLPDELPGDIRDVAVRIALGQLDAIASAGAGSRRTVQRFGDGAVTVDGIDWRYEERLLARLISHRRFA